MAHPLKSIVALLPPAVERTQLGHPVQRRLHAAGTGGLERHPGQIEPEIHALHQQVGQVHVVVLEERHPALERGVPGELVDALQHFLARIVGRMRLAREDDLHRPPRVHQQPPQPVDIAEDQVGPLVGGEPAGEADGERHRVEQGSRAHHLCGFLELAGKAAPGVLAHEVGQRPLLPQVGLPELGMIQREDLIPEARLLEPVSPVRAQVLVQQRHDRARHPGGQMHAVGDVPDRHRLPRPVGPELAPEIAGDLAVPAGDAVHPGGEPHGDRRSCETDPAGPGARPGRRACSRSTPISSQTGPVQASSWSAVKASCPAGTGVWVVKTLCARTCCTASSYDAPAATSSRTRSTSMNAACPSLACHTRGIDAHGPKHPYAADAEDPFLPQPQLGPAGVELVHQPAVVRVVRLEVGVEQIDRHPAHHHLPGPHVHRPPEVSTVVSQGCRPDPITGTSGVALTSYSSSLSSCHPSRRQPLVEVALTVEEPDAHQRNPEVAGRLAVVAGEHTEAAGVDRHRVVEAELGAEVGHRPAIQVGIVPGKPGIAVIRLVLHPLHDVVVTPQKVAVAGAGGDARRVDPAEQLQRIVPGAMPQRLVDGLKERPRLATPAPPQVHRERCETLDAGRQVGNAALWDEHGQL